MNMYDVTFDTRNEIMIDPYMTTGTPLQSRIINTPPFAYPITKYPDIRLVHLEHHFLLL